MPKIRCEECGYKIPLNLGERVGRDTIFVCPSCHGVLRVGRSDR